MLQEVIEGVASLFRVGSFRLFHLLRQRLALAPLRFLLRSLALVLVGVAQSDARRVGCLDAVVRHRSDQREDAVRARLCFPVVVHVQRKGDVARLPQIEGVAFVVVDVNDPAARVGVPGGGGVKLAAVLLLVLRFDHKCVDVQHTEIGALFQRFADRGRAVGGDVVRQLQLAGAARVHDLPVHNIGRALRGELQRGLQIAAQRPPAGDLPVLQHEHAVRLVQQLQQRPVQRTLVALRDHRVACAVNERCTGGQVYRGQRAGHELLHRHAVRLVAVAVVNGDILPRQAGGGHVARGRDRKPALTDADAPPLRLRHRAAAFAQPLDRADLVRRVQRIQHILPRKHPRK